MAQSRLEREGGVVILCARTGLRPSVQLGQHAGHGWSIDISRLLSTHFLRSLLETIINVKVRMPIRDCSIRSHCINCALCGGRPEAPFPDRSLTAVKPSCVLFQLLALVFVVRLHKLPITLIRRIQGAAQRIKVACQFDLWTFLFKILCRSLRRALVASFPKPTPRSCACSSRPS